MVAGTTYRDMDTDAREGLAAILRRPDEVFAEQLVLHTCHRVEKFGVLADGQLPDLPSGTTWYRGTAAIERVFLVVGGFDSAIVGEEQILGQVRDAFQDALDAGTAGPLLGELMRRAIRFGKRVRSQARPTGERSLADRAAQWLVAHMAQHAGASALVIGTGEMGRQLATQLAAAGVSVTVASRHVARAAQLAGVLPQPGPHRSVGLEEVLSRPLEFEAVAVALRGGTTPVTELHVSAGQAHVVDLSAPRSVTAGAAVLLGDRLLDLDTLGNGARATTLSPSAEARLREEAHREAQRFAGWLELRSSGHGIALLHHHADEVRQRHLDRLATRADLSAPQARAVAAMTEALVAELLHVPTVQLRRDPEAAQRVREVFGID
jgi:glutamyl-tRNA reductase